MVHSEVESSKNSPPKMQRQGSLAYITPLTIKSKFNHLKNLINT